MFDKLYSYARKLNEYKEIKRETYAWLSEGNFQPEINTNSSKLAFKKKNYRENGEKVEHALYQEYKRRILKSKIAEENVSFSILTLSLGKSSSGYAIQPAQSKSKIKEISPSKTRKRHWESS